MKIKPEELKDSGYALIDKLDHLEIIPFVKTYLRKRTRISLLYTICNILITGIMVCWFWKNYDRNDFILMDGFSYLSFGIAFTFVLIPLHEYIHALAYKSQGALNTSYDVNLKKFYFMAIADNFVANKKEFQIVALAPFVTISISLIIIFFFSGQLWRFTILGILMTHTAFSSGDFGLLSYFEHHKEKDIVTYDDKTKGISYFYGKDR